MAAYEALKKKKKKKKHWPLGPVENKLWWPELARQPQKGMRASGHIANVKVCTPSNTCIVARFPAVTPNNVMTPLRPMSKGSTHAARERRTGLACMQSFIMNSTNLP